MSQASQHVRTVRAARCDGHIWLTNQYKEDTNGHTPSDVAMMRLLDQHGNTGERLELRVGIVSRADVN